MYPGIDQDASGFSGCWYNPRIMTGRRVVIYSPGFDVDTGYFGVVVCSKDGEFDGSTPTVGLCDGIYVFVRWHAIWIWLVGMND